jgi:2-(1,2-epoxy-1,2-dihydrophenyl)acetyl-CoA isomerase
MSTLPSGLNRPEPDLLVHRDGPVAVLTLNRPHAANAFGGTLMADLLSAAVALEADDEVRVVVTAANGPTWCVGADLNDFVTATDLTAEALLHGTEVGGAKGLPSMSADERAEDRLGIGRWVMEFRRLTKPLIAAVDGPVAGGGLSLLLLHDLRVASTRARFSTGFANVGVGPEMGLSWTLPRLVGAGNAARMMLTGSIDDAERAAQIGLVDRLVGPGGARDAALEWAHQIAALPPRGIAATMNALRRSPSNDLERQLEVEWSGQRHAFAGDDVAAAVHQLHARLVARRSDAARPA